MVFSTLLMFHTTIGLITPFFMAAPTHTVHDGPAHAVPCTRACAGGGGEVGAPRAPPLGSAARGVRGPGASLHAAGWVKSRSVCVWVRVRVGARACGCACPARHGGGRVRVWVWVCLCPARHGVAGCVCACPERHRVAGCMQCARVAHIAHLLTACWAGDCVCTRSAGDLRLHTRKRWRRCTREKARVHSSQTSQIHTYTSRKYKTIQKAKDRQSCTCMHARALQVQRLVRQGAGTARER